MEHLPLGVERIPTFYVLKEDNKRRVRKFGSQGTGSKHENPSPRSLKNSVSLENEARRGKNIGSSSRLARRSQERRPGWNKSLEIKEWIATDVWRFLSTRSRDEIAILSSLDEKPTIVWLILRTCPTRVKSSTKQKGRQGVRNSGDRSEERRRERERERGNEERQARHNARYISTGTWHKYIIHLCGGVSFQGVPRQSFIFGL